MQEPDFLSKHFLDVLAIQNPEIYTKTMVILSDFWEKSQDYLPLNSVFSKHLDHLRFETMDCLNPQFEYSPFFIFFSNLIDSTPVEHIYIESGTPYALYVETQIPNTAYILDNLQKTPHRFSARAIQNTIENKQYLSSKELNFLFRTQLGSQLTELYHRIPLHESELTKKEQAFITHLISRHDLNTTGYFNVHLDMIHAFNMYYERLNDGGAIIFSDFGFFNHTLPKEDALLMKRYGNHHFSSVFFDLFMDFPQILKTNIQDYSSETIGIFKGIIPNKLDFESEFQSPQALSFFSDAVTSDKTPHDIHTFKTLLSRLPKSDNYNYSILVQSIYSHLQEGHVELAKLCCDLGLDIYKEFGLSFLTLKGAVLFQLGEYDEARSVLNYALCISKGQCHTTVKTLAMVLRKLNLPIAEKHTINLALSQCPPSDYGDMLLYLFEYHKHYNNTKHAQETGNTLREFIHTFPDLVSQGLAKSFDQ